MSILSEERQRFVSVVFALLLCVALALPSHAEGGLQNNGGIEMLPLNTADILSVGNQTAGKCSWFCLRYARTILDGTICSGKGMWNNGAVWSAAGYRGFDGDRTACLQKIYSELKAGRPVIVHLKNVHVDGVKKHSERISTYEYVLTGNGWKAVNYPHIATSSHYGHWVCVVGVHPNADPSHLKESDFFALDPARVSANGVFSLTQLLDNTLWTTNSPLKITG